jgi:Domain of Unknown Function (DUF1259)
MVVHKARALTCGRPFAAATLLLVCATLGRAQAPKSEHGPAADWKAVDQAMGRPGKAQPGEVYKYSFPRSDLQVRIGDVTVRPALGLGGWVAFKRMGTDAIAMGDLVLLESEVTPVMTELQEMGVTQTALHNHLLHESPHVMYMHIGARGDPTKVAQAVHAALVLTRTPPAAPPSAAAASVELDTTRIASTLGHGGTVNGGVYQVSVPRADPVRVEGMEVPPSMGVATAINFQPTVGGKAAVTGDFVLVAGEVNPVIQALRAGGIQVTALHSHMLTEEPRLFFMHFWANDDALKLARALRAAIDRTRSKPATSSSPRS